MCYVTLAPLTPIKHWMVRSCDFPRFQFVFLGLILLIIQYVLLDFSNLTSILLISINFSCIIYHLWRIYPYTLLGKSTVKSNQIAYQETTLSILNVNVLMSNNNAEKLIDIINKANPDIIAMFETNRWWENALKQLEKNYRYTIKVPLDNRYGMHLYSNFKLIDSSVKYLVDKNIPSIHCHVELPSKAQVEMHFMHPAPPSPTESPTSISRDVELLILAQSLENKFNPIIVSGDLNDVAWSRTHDRFLRKSGLLDPRVGRGLLSTFHAKYPFVRWPLDHIFHSHHFSVISLERLEKFGSDHFPLLTKLHLDKID